MISAAQTLFFKNRTCAKGTVYASDRWFGKSLNRIELGWKQGCFHSYQVQMGPEHNLHLAELGTELRSFPESETYWTVIEPNIKARPNKATMI